MLAMTREVFQSGTPKKPIPCQSSTGISAQWATHSLCRWRKNGEKISTRRERDSRERVRAIYKYKPICMRPAVRAELFTFNSKTEKKKKSWRGRTGATAVFQFGIIYISGEKKTFIGSRHHNKHNRAIEIGWSYKIAECFYCSSRNAWEVFTEIKVRGLRVINKHSHIHINKSILYNNLDQLGFLQRNIVCGWYTGTV